MQSVSTSHMIRLNGREAAILAGETLASLLSRQNLAGRFAVEVNQEVVPRSEYAARLLADGDTVEIVRAIGGG